MLEIVHGKTRHQAEVSQLVEKLKLMGLDGTLYIGYPIIASADESFSVEALLVCHQHGIVAFTFSSAPRDEVEWKELAELQDKLYFALKNSLGRHQALRVGRELGVEIHVMTFLPADVQKPEDEAATVAGPRGVQNLLEGFDALPAQFSKPLNAALQRVTTIKPVKKRAGAITAGTRGSILKIIEKEIANLDQWQKTAAIETPDGPQRIRGLAGSGKTVVLALKAAYLHAQYPEWKIALTFFSRSLYQQFKDLVRRFSFEHRGDEPNWENLQVLHAWGGTSKPGVYTEMAEAAGLTPRDWVYAKSAYGSSGGFAGICRELLGSIKSAKVSPIFDAILVDEAQDLPSEFFQLIHRFTKEPKRIIWAYDELQNLSEGIMASTDALFGFGAEGHPLVTLSNTDGQARQDIILPVCYRNTPWALTLAHALGFGLYRKPKLVQHFDDPGVWGEVGYAVKQGELNFGSKVVLERKTNSYPSYFAEYLDPDDAVIAKRFENDETQAAWVATEIAKNLAEEELEFDDILVIFPSALTAKSKSRPLIAELARKNIRSHLVGVTTSQDEVFTKDSIAVSHIYRAKGNEAPIVYLMNAHESVTGYELIKLRNILFTGITRSRAWIRICGWGSEMDVLMAEIDKVRDGKFQLRFKIPTEEELTKLRTLHRDRTANEKHAIKIAEKGLKEFLAAIESGDISLDNLPEGLRRKLSKVLPLYEIYDDSDSEEDPT